MIKLISRAKFFFRSFSLSFAVWLCFLNSAAPTELLASSALRPDRAVLHQLNRIPYLSLFDFSYSYLLRFLVSDRGRKSELVRKK